MKATQQEFFNRITESLIRKRAEHNEGMVSNLEEIALHQQNIGKIELLGQLCPHLKILYLQNNLISKLQNLHKLKELQYLNMAVNNITKIENLQRCESLAKLDLTINFIDKAGLLSVPSLAANICLTELTLMGNPCTEWSGYRSFVIAHIPHLKKLDGQDVKPSERIAAKQLLAVLTTELRRDLVRQGIDPDQAAQVEDDSIFDENGEVRETGTVDETTGEIRRPWCVATRLLDHIENERANREADERKRASSKTVTALDDDKPKRPDRYEDFPDIRDGESVMQRNQGGWEFSVEESDDRRHIVLEVEVGRYLDTSLIKADIQPTYIRLLIKGKLLQLLLPCGVRPDASRALRSQATGRLVVEMTKIQSEAQPNIALLRPKQRPGTRSGQLVSNTSTSLSGASGLSRKAMPTTAEAAVGDTAGDATRGQSRSSTGRYTGEFLIRETRRAAVQTHCGEDDDDSLPDLT